MLDTGGGDHPGETLYILRPSLPDKLGLWLLCGVFLAAPLAVGAYFVAERSPLVGGCLTTLAVIASLPALYRQSLSLHVLEAGLRRHTWFGGRCVVHDEDIASVTFKPPSTTAGMIVVGVIPITHNSTVAGVFEVAPLKGRPGCRIRWNVIHEDDRWPALVGRISDAISLRMGRMVEAGEPVGWTRRLRFLADGLEVGAAGLGGEPIPYRLLDVKAVAGMADWLVYRRDTDTLVDRVPHRSPNSLAGALLLSRLAEEAHIAPGRGPRPSRSYDGRGTRSRGSESREYPYGRSWGSIAVMTLLFGAISAFVVHWALTDDRGMVIKRIPLDPTWATRVRWCGGLVCVGVTLSCVAWGLERALYPHRVALTPDGLVVPVAWSSDETLVPYGEIAEMYVEGASGKPEALLILTRERTFRIERFKLNGYLFEELTALLTDRIERQARDKSP